MARVVLQPCRLFGDSFGIWRGKELVEVSWDGFLDRLAPSSSIYARQRLVSARQGAFVGTIRSSKTGRPTSFVIYSPDGSSNVSQVLKQDPSFSDRIIEVFRVESINIDRSISEDLGAQNARA